MKHSPEELIQLYPLPSRTLPLTGAYLAHDLRQMSAASGGAYVYANFVTSLDGRIAAVDPYSGRMGVPKEIANERDWRLFQELAVQSDIVISSGRYLRDYASGKAQDILRVYDDPRFVDLRDWRQTRGLSAQPALAVVSASLGFPIPAPLLAGGRQVIVFTTEQADRQRRRALEAQGVPVVMAGIDSVVGDRLVRSMLDLGYRTIYSGAGPQVLHLLLTASVVDRLYLTLAQRLLGGEYFASLVEGARLTPAAGMRLYGMYFDPAGLDGLGQLFLTYDRA